MYGHCWNFINFPMDYTRRIPLEKQRKDFCKLEKREWRGKFRGREMVGRSEKVDTRKRELSYAIVQTVFAVLPDHKEHHRTVIR